MASTDFLETVFLTITKQGSHNNVFIGDRQIPTRNSSLQSIFEIDF